MGKSFGLKVGPWFTHGGNIVYTPADADFSIAEVEGQADYDGLVLAMKNGMLPACPLAIATNFGGIEVKVNGETDIAVSRARAKPLIDAGFHCLPELYLRQDNGAPTGVTGEALDAKAIQLGWANTSGRVFGIFGGAMLSDYTPWMDRPFSVYIGEAIL